MHRENTTGDQKQIFARTSCDIQASHTKSISHSPKNIILKFHFAFLVIMHFIGIVASTFTTPAMTSTEQQAQIMITSQASHTKSISHSPKNIFFEFRFAFLIIMHFIEIVASTFTTSAMASTEELATQLLKTQASQTNE